MARKSETIVTLIDDLDGTKADRTITFAVDGTAFEIELSKKNAGAFEKALKPYLDAARRVRPNSSRARTSPAARRPRTALAAVRAWARENGHEVSDRGRIPKAVQDAYDASH